MVDDKIFQRALEFCRNDFFEDNRDCSRVYITDIIKELYQYKVNSLQPNNNLLKESKYNQCQNIIKNFNIFLEYFNMVNQFPSDPKPIGYDKALNCVLEQIVSVQVKLETFMLALQPDESVRNKIRHIVMEGANNERK